MLTSSFSGTGPYHGRLASWEFPTSRCRRRSQASPLVKAYMVDRDSDSGSDKSIGYRLQGKLFILPCPTSDQIERHLKRVGNLWQY